MADGVEGLAGGAVDVHSAVAPAGEGSGEGAVGADQVLRGDVGEDLGERFERWGDVFRRRGGGGVRGFRYRGGGAARALGVLKRGERAGRLWRGAGAWR